MSVFEDLLKAPAEQLLKLLYKTATERDQQVPGGRTRQIARKLGLTHAQLISAVGFNSFIRDLPDVVTLLGFADYEELARLRNRVFSGDVYDRLGIKDVLAVYHHVKDDAQHLQVMQYLLAARLRRIEACIEATVNSLVIERYKREMRAIYHEGVAQLEFIEERLRNTHSGFRALLNEVVMIVESRQLPVGEIFFRSAILPEEKRRLISKGFVPRALVESRLQDSDLSPQERRVLEEQLKLM